jgi:hypothetical protein
MLMLYNYSSEAASADCHDCHSSRSGSNSVHDTNRGPRYDDTEHSTQSDTYSSETQTDHHRSRNKRGTDDLNSKDHFGYIVSGDYFLLTSDDNSFLGKSVSHTGSDDSSEFDYSGIKLMGTSASNEQYSSETEDTRGSDDVDDVKTKYYKSSHSPMQDQENDKHSAPLSLPDHSASRGCFMCRNQRHSAFESNKDVSEETKYNFEHLLQSDNLEHSTVFPYTANKADSFSYTASDEDTSTYEDKPWVHSSGTQDFSKKDANFIETVSFLKQNADDEANISFQRHKNIFLDKELGTMEPNNYEHSIMGLPRDRLIRNKDADQTDTDVDLNSTNKRIRAKVRNGDKNDMNNFKLVDTNGRHRRVGLYGTENAKEKQLRNYHHNNVKGTAHEETEENILDKMGHASLPQTMQRDLSDAAVFMYNKTNTTANKKEQNISNKFMSKMTEGQNNEKLDIKYNFQSQVKHETPVKSNGDSKESDEFTNMYKQEIRTDSSSTSKPLNPLQNKTTFINRNQEQMNQTRYHNQGNSSTDNGTRFSSEINHELQATDRTNNARNSIEAGLKITYLTDNINQYEEKINFNNSECPSEGKCNENKSARNYDKTENRSDTARWKRFEASHQSSNIDLPKAHPWQQQQTRIINTVNEHDSSPWCKSNVKSSCNKSAKSATIPFVKQEYKLFRVEPQQNIKYIDGKEQYERELLITDTPEHLHEKDNSIGSVKASTHPKLILRHSNEHRSDLERKEHTGTDQSTLYSASYGNNFQTDKKLSGHIYGDISFVHNDKENVGNFPWKSNGILTSVEKNGGGYQPYEYDLKYKQTGDKEGHAVVRVSAQNNKEYTCGRKGNKNPVHGEVNIIGRIPHSYPCRKRGTILSQQQHMKLKKDVHDIETLTQNGGNIDIYRRTGPWDYLSHHRNHGRSSNGEINTEDNIKDYRTSDVREASYHPKFYIQTDNTKIFDSIPDIKTEEFEYYRSDNERDPHDSLRNYPTIHLKETQYHPYFQIKARNRNKCDIYPINNENHAITENIPPHIFHQLDETYFTKCIPQTVSPYGINSELNNDRFPGNNADLIRSNIRPSILFRQGKTIQETNNPTAGFKETVDHFPYSNDNISSGIKYGNTDRNNIYNAQQRRVFDRDESILPKSVDKVVNGDKYLIPRNLHVPRYSSEHFKKTANPEEELDIHNYGQIDNTNSRLETEGSVGKLPVHLRTYSTNNQEGLKPESKSKFELTNSKYNTENAFKIVNEATFPSVFSNVNINYSQGPNYNSHLQKLHINKSKQERTEDLLGPELYDDAEQLKIEESISKILGKHRTADTNILSSDNKNWGYTNKKILHDVKPDYNSHSQKLHINKSKPERTKDILGLELYDDAEQLKIEESMSKIFGKHGTADTNILSSDNKNWGHTNKNTLHDVKANDYSVERSYTGINSNADDFKSNKIKFQSKIKLPCTNHKEGSNTGQYINIRKCQSHNNMNIVNHPKSIKYYETSKGQQPTNVVYKSEGKNAAVHEITISPCNKNGRTALREGPREGIIQSQGINKILNVPHMGNIVRRCKVCIQEEKACGVSKAIAENEARPSLLYKGISSDTEAVSKCQRCQKTVKERDIGEMETGNIYEYSIRTDDKLVPNHKHESQYNRQSSAPEERSLSENLYNQRHGPLTTNPLDHKFRAEEYQLLENVNGKERHPLESKTPKVHEHWKGYKFPLVTFQEPPSMTVNYKGDKIDTSMSSKNNFDQLSSNHRVVTVIQGPEETKYYRDDDDDDDYRHATDTEGHLSHHINTEPGKHSHLDNKNYNSRRNNADLMTQYQEDTKYIHNDVTKINSNKQTSNLYEPVGYGDVVDKALFENYHSENLWPNSKKRSYEVFVHQQPEEYYFTGPDETEEEPSRHSHHETNPRARDYIYKINQLRLDNYHHNDKKTQQNHSQQKADLNQIYSIKDDSALEGHKHAAATNTKQKATINVQRETKEAGTKHHGFSAGYGVTKSRFEDRLHTQDDHINEHNYFDKESIKPRTEAPKFGKINSFNTKHDVRESLFGKSQTTHALQSKTDDTEKITEDLYEKQREDTNFIKVKDDRRRVDISRPQHDSGTDSSHEPTEDISIILNDRQPKVYSSFSAVEKHVHKNKEDNTAPSRHGTEYVKTTYSREHSEYKEATSMDKNKSKQNFNSPYAILKYFPGHYRQYEDDYPSENWEIYEPQGGQRHSHEAYPREVVDSDVGLETQIKSPQVFDDY